jgi:uncharacterized membrane protein
MTSSQQRLAYIDWMRGLACVLMFQTHCYDSWLSAGAKQSALYGWSRLGGTLPAPLFIFLAGISVALVTEKLRAKGVERGAIAKQVILRGAEVFGLGILFRVQEYILGFRYVPWTDLARVDVLNILGISMILLGVVCWAVGGGTAVGAMRARSLAASVLVAAAVAMLTPMLWTTWRPRFLPWAMESYVNGVHIFGVPQPWLFPMFPWVAFAFVGLAAGLMLHTEFAKKAEGWSFALLGAAGAAACWISVLLDESSVKLYAVYDYWHTSPNFVLMRCGILLMILFGAYAWCRWGPGVVGFSPLVQLGKTSLLVYWVHIEFVYGRFSILPKGRCGVGAATAGLAVICLAMLGLSVARTRWKERKG